MENGEWRMENRAVESADLTHSILGSEPIDNGAYFRGINFVVRAAPVNATAIPAIILIVTSSIKKTAPKSTPKIGMMKVTVVVAVAPDRESKSNKRRKATAVESTASANAHPMAGQLGSCSGIRVIANGVNSSAAVKRFPIVIDQGDRSAM